MKKSVERRAANCIVRCPERGFLIVRRSGYESRAGTWEFPGGGIEEGETAKEAARRELREETGLKGEVVTRGHPVSLLSDGELLVIEHFLLKVEPEENVSLSHEHDRYRWEDLEKLRKSDELLEWFSSLERIGISL